MFHFIAQTSPAEVDVYMLVMKWGLPPALLIAVGVLWKVIARLYRERTTAEKDKLKIEKEKLQLEKEHSEKIADLNAIHREALEKLRNEQRVELAKIEKERRDYTIRVEKERREQAMGLLREQREIVEKSGQALVEMMQTIKTLSPSSDGPRS